MKEGIKLVCFAVFWVMWGVVVCLCLMKCGSTPNDKRLFEEEIKRDTVVVHDTIVEIEPVPVNTEVTENIKRKLPLAKPDTTPSTKDFYPKTDIFRDSVEVEIPITQVEYADSNYRAWVSGYEPRLDSIYLYQQREIVTIEKTVTKYKNKHWHIGPTIGYGYTPKGFEPFIGISLTYSIISF